jgi:SAM-dependent methyltransferase
LNRDFLREYSTEASIRKYTKETAGSGISYLLDHDYGNIYLDFIKKCIPESKLQQGIRVWEFGCGGGMNLVQLVSLLERRGIALECAYGTDFSETLIAAANQEAKKYLTPAQREKVRFCNARNENLVEDLTQAVGIPQESLLGSFDFILGVNTIRYCIRLKTDEKCAKEIYSLLTDGGVCVVIDMNNRFPAFRSALRDWLTKEKLAYYLPTLEEYKRPFAATGFDLLRTGNFCWIPHSAGPGLTSVMRKLTPILNAVVPSRAMRSLVVSRKNAHRSNPA